MALHLSGEIHFQNIVDEFKTIKPIKFSEMYAGGGYVPEANLGVPKSGAISLGNFYGATAALVIDYNITADMFNFNSSTVLANSSWDGVTPVILTVNIAEGIVVSSNNTSTPAFEVSALPIGSQVFINNNGYIIGMGGAGYNATNGQNGGAALSTAVPTTVNNLGTIAGGGGGGGGGYSSDSSSTWYGSGGGGRSGRANATVQSSHTEGFTSSFWQAQVGTFTAAGIGGGYSDPYGNGNRFRGGTGGDWGAAGGTAHRLNGGSRTHRLFAGGEGGAAVDGNSLITWVSEGTIAGATV